MQSVLLPKATVNRLAKSVLKSNEILSKEGLSVIQRSSTVFINYIHHYAREFSMDANRKTVNEDDILLAIQKCEFEGGLPTLRQELDSAHYNGIPHRRFHREPRSTSRSGLAKWLKMQRVLSVSETF